MLQQMKGKLSRRLLSRQSFEFNVSQECAARILLLVSLAPRSLSTKQLMKTIGRAGKRIVAQDQKLGTSAVTTGTANPPRPLVNFLQRLQPRDVLRSELCSPRADSRRCAPLACCNLQALIS